MWALAFWPGLWPAGFWLEETFLYGTSDKIVFNIDLLVKPMWRLRKAVRSWRWTVVK
jgi:hypothetical protein